MKNAIVFLASVFAITAVAAQEPKPVPKDSVRVYVPGCSRGVVFTARSRPEAAPGTSLPEGTRLRMNGPKDLMADIKGQEGSMIEITGLVKKGQIVGDGLAVGNVRIAPGGSGPSSPMGGSITGGAGAVGYISVDVEGWRRIPGECPTR
jgi:hypothetical protein